MKRKLTLVSLLLALILIVVFVYNKSLTSVPEPEPLPLVEKEIVLLDKKVDISSSTVINNKPIIKPTLPVVSTTSKNTSSTTVEAITILSPKNGEELSLGTIKTVTWTDTIPKLINPNQNCGDILCLEEVDIKDRLYTLWLVSSDCKDSSLCYKEPQIIASGINGRSYDWKVGNTITNSVSVGKSKLYVCRTIGSLEYLFEKCDQIGSEINIISPKPVINHAPKITSYVYMPTDVDTSQSVNIRLTATDEDNDDLYWLADPDQSGVESFEACPASVSQTGAGKEYSYNDHYSKAGTYNVIAYVTDCRGGNYKTTFELIVVNPKLITPNGGETWKRGQTYELTWGQKEGYNRVEISLVHPDGNEHKIGVDTATNGTFSWYVPLDFETGKYYVTIFQYKGDQQSYSSSKSSFTIAD